MLYFAGLLIYAVVIALLAAALIYPIKTKKHEDNVIETLAPSNLEPCIHGGFSLLKLVIIFMGLLAGGNTLAAFIQRNILMPDGQLFMATDGIRIFSEAWLLLSLLLTANIYIHMYPKEYDYVVKYKCQLSVIAEKLSIVARVIQLIIFIIAFPICILGIGDYLYFSDNYIGVERFWSVSEKQYGYEEIYDAYVSYDNPITLRGGYKFYYDIYFNDDTNEIF